MKVKTVKTLLKEAFETSRKNVADFREAIKKEIACGSKLLSMPMQHYSLLGYHGIPLNLDMQVYVWLEKEDGEQHILPTTVNKLYLDTKEWYDESMSIFPNQSVYRESKALKLLEVAEDSDIEFVYWDETYYICKIGDKYTADNCHPFRRAGTIDTPLYLARESYMVNFEYELPREALEYIEQHLSKDEFITLKDKFPHFEDDKLFITNDKDRKMEVRPGRLILGIAPYLDNEIIKEFARLVQTCNKLDLHTSSAPDDFEMAYRECLRTGSCMDGGESDFPYCIVDGEFYHPSRVYAHSDNNILVAWATDAEGTIIARCLVNNATKEYTRVYFNSTIKNSEDKFRNLLQKNGYSFNPTCLLGQKLNKVKSDDDGIICPFIDPKNLGVKVTPTHLIVGGDYKANYKDGHLEAFPPLASLVGHCSCCNSVIRDGDDYAYTVHEEIICCNCISEFVEVLDFNSGCRAYAYKSEAYLVAASFSIKLYGIWQEVQRGEYVYNIAGSDVVILERAYYGAKVVAHIADCVIGHTDVVLSDDLDRLGLFFNEDDCDLCEVSDYVVLDDELTHHMGEPKNNWEEAGYYNHDYPMLRNYITRIDGEE